MEGRSRGTTFQDVIARKGTCMTSQDALDEIQCCGPKWYVSRSELEDHTPSRRDGIDFRTETQLRSWYCSFVEDLGMKLKLNPVTVATAMVFCHRVYLYQSLAKNDWQTIATACMFLASKVEETPRSLMDVIVVAYETLHGQDPAASRRIRQKDVYEKQKALILTGERLLLATLDCDFVIISPCKTLVAALYKLEIFLSPVAKGAYNFVNMWLRTTLCLQYEPQYIAVGSIYLAAKRCGVKLPLEREHWWLEFDVSYHQLAEVLLEMLRLLDDKRRRLRATLEKNAMKAEVEVGGGKARQSSDDVRNGKVSQCQTITCDSSSRSDVEDGEITDDGEVLEKTACKIVSNDPNIALRKRKCENAAAKDDDASWKRPRF